MTKAMQKPQSVEAKNKGSDPDFIITKTGELYKFQCWYWMQCCEHSWLAASAVNKRGKTFAIAASNIETKIFNTKKWPK